MDEISVLVYGNNNLSGKTWWLDTIENEATVPIPLDGSEGGLWSGNFVPPPPRPLFLEDTISPDGLTTCDLCSWAWNTKTFTLDATLGASGKVEWVLTLVIVSLISAVVGAVVMVIALYCRRMKNAITSNNVTTSNTMSIEATEEVLDDKVARQSLTRNQSRSLWYRLFQNSSAPPSQLNAPPTPTNENHYTHMDEAYNITDEALYAELDQYSNSPAYQNSGYADADVPPSSAPSSAYYSDLSVNTNNDRTYEIIGLATTPVWDLNDPLQRVKLSAINETATVPSDYV